MPPLTIDADGWITAVDDTHAQPSSPLKIPVDGASSSTASSSSRSSSDADTKESTTTSNSSTGWIAGTDDIQKPIIALPTAEQPTDTASTTSTSASSSSEASVGSSTHDTPARLRPRTRPSALPLPALGVNPKLLVGKVLTHIRRSPDHPAVTLSFADGTTYQILVDGYDPRHGAGSGSGPGPGSSARACVLEMDEALLRMLEVPGRHVVDRAIADCAHIQLADKAYERREWEQSWPQSHVAVAFKFAEERRWHCVWAMRAEYDERGCTFRAFDDVYLQALERQPPRSPQRLRSDAVRQAPPSPEKSAPKVQSSPQKSAPKPPPSPTAKKTANLPPNTPRKNRNRNRKKEGWKKDI